MIVRGRYVMAIIVDIDTGGTFTDGLFSSEEKTERVKVDTTPHDLTMCFFSCLKDGATTMGFAGLEEFLPNVDIIRWSSTFATNIVAEKKGRKVGLFVTNGHGEDLYSDLEESPVIGQIIDRTSVEEITWPPNEEEILYRLRALLEKGVRRIVISLQGGLENPQAEQAIRDVLESQYPDHYLGTVPFLLGNEICKHPDDMTRTHIGLLNAYVHGPMAQAMFRAEDDLRDKNYGGALLLGRINGGVARVAKTKPVDTIESGPIFGIHAAAYLAKIYGLPKVVTLDVGGTTTKVGLVESFRPVMASDIDILGVPVRQSMLTLESIALGGGTVAKSVDGMLTLGPESMGAYPGPACYDLGGTAPTLTDAFLIAGVFDPNYFAGGTKPVNLAQAEKVMEERIAKPLGLTIAEASTQIVNTASTMIAEVLKRMLRKPQDYVLFAFGGNGSILGAPVANQVGIGEVKVFDLGSVLSAFGSAVADVVHTYEYALFQPISDRLSIIEATGWMAEEAIRDMQGEGFDVSACKSTLEFSLHKTGGNDVMSIPWDLSASTTGGDFTKELDDLLPANIAGTRQVEVLRLDVRVPMKKLAASSGLSARDSKNKVSRKGTRSFTWERSTPSSIDVYEWDLTKPGEIIKGEAIIEGRDTTYVVPSGWILSIDEFCNGTLTKE